MLRLKRSVGLNEAVKAHATRKLNCSCPESHSSGNYVRQQSLLYEQAGHKGIELKHPLHKAKCPRLTHRAWRETWARTVAKGDSGQEKMIVPVRETRTLAFFFQRT